MQFELNYTIMMLLSYSLSGLLTPAWHTSTRDKKYLHTKVNSKRAGKREWSHLLKSRTRHKNSLIIQFKHGVTWSTDEQNTSSS